MARYVYGASRSYQARMYRIARRRQGGRVSPVDRETSRRAQARKRGAGRFATSSSNLPPIAPPQPLEQSLVQAYADAFREVVSTYERELLEQVTTPTSEDFVRAATDLQAIRRRLRKEAEMETLDIAELATLDRLMADCGASSDLLQRRYQSARKRPQQVSVGGWFSWIFGA